MVLKPELRIGNNLLFITGTGKEHIVVVKELHTVEAVLVDPVRNFTYCMFYTSVSLQPVPLTASILEACGFVKDKDGLLMILFGKSGLYWLETKMQLAVGYAPMINLDCRFLHTLQNQYYYFSQGKELIYKP